MPSFNNFNNMQKRLEDVIAKSLSKVTDDVFEELYRYIDEQVYQLGVLKIEPSLSSFGYEQTRQFIDALKRTAVISTGSDMKTTIYFDYREMIPRRTTDRFFNSHMGLNGEESWEGKGISAWLPTWLDTGIDSPHYQHTGIEFTEFIEDFINKNFNRLMRQELKKYGLIMR